MKEIVSYIIQFLIGTDSKGEFSQMVGYTNDINQFAHYRVVIIPSLFFKKEIYGTPQSLPNHPLKEVENIPLLFGSSKTEWIGNTWVVHADIIASSYFLITRYEEIIKRDLRDVHGRFPGKESLPYKEGFIHRPIVDEYGKLLRKWLRQAQVKGIEEPTSQIRKVWLTHDIDAPFYCRSLRNVVRETFKGAGFVQALKWYFGTLENDPYYTFPKLFKQDIDVKKQIGKERCEIICFFKAGGKTQQDKPVYNLQSKDIRILLSLCKKEQVTIGLHSSYSAGQTPSLILSEKAILEKATGVSLFYNRHHFLSSREPEDLDILEKAGITDDFTMGYADIAGFRLGTSRPVHWINPTNKHISSLVLHPLTIMDCTLNEPNYMGLNDKEAQTYCLNLLEKIHQTGGELVLLWHNNSFCKNTAYFHSKLYTTINEALMNL